jgi:MFS family permease
MEATAGKTGAAQEWRAYWYLPLVAGIGYTAPLLYAYALGPFVEPLQEAFGWSRAQVMTGNAIANLPTVILLPLFGLLIERWGPRRVGLIGVTIMPLGFGLLGTATGTDINWWMLWAFIAICVPFVQASVWTSPVVARFAAGRGLAMAVALSIGALASGVMPLLATLLLTNFGWRQGFMGVGLVWFLLMFLPVLLFFRGPQDGSRAARQGNAAASDALPGLTLPEALRRFSFYKLLFAAITFSLVVVTMTIHAVPMLKGLGASPLQAASTVALFGLFSIVGRLGMGWLVDRYPSHIVSAAYYLLPIPAYLLLITSGTSPTVQMVAVAMMGLGGGGQVGAVAYLITRHFGLKRFASLTSVLFSLVALGSAIGPVSAGAVFDHAGSYVPYMIAAMVLTAIAALGLVSLGRPPYGAAGH